MGCGDIDECDATGTGLNDCANIAAAGNYADSFTCTNTIGSYTCDRGAETLQPNTAPWSEDGSGQGYKPIELYFNIDIDIILICIPGIRW